MPSLTLRASPFKPRFTRLADFLAHVDVQVIEALLNAAGPRDLHALDLRIVA